MFAAVDNHQMRNAVQQWYYHSQWLCADICRQERSSASLPPPSFARPAAGDVANLPVFMLDMPTRIAAVDPTPVTLAVPSMAWARALQPPAMHNGHHVSWRHHPGGVYRPFSV